MPVLDDRLDFSLRSSAFILPTRSPSTESHHHRPEERTAHIAGYGRSGRNVRSVDHSPFEQVDRKDKSGCGVPKNPE